MFRGHIRQISTLRMLRRRLNSSRVIVLFTTLSILIVAASCQDEFEQGQQVAENNGVQMRLENVAYEPGRTVLTLDVIVQERDAIDVDTVLPIGPERIETTGVTGDPAFFGTERHFGVDGNTQRIEVAVGPVESHESGATVDITAVGVQSTEERYEWVEGPWSFELTPEASDITQWNTVDLPSEHDTPDSAVYAEIRQMRVSDAGISIDYDIVRDEGVDALPIGYEVYLAMPDSRVVEGNQRVPHGQSASEGGSILFPPLPTDADTFTIAFGDYLVAERGPVEVMFTLPESVGATEGRTEVDLDVAFTVAGETLRVTQLVAVAPTDEHPSGSVEIHVQSDMQDEEASVRFIGPDTSGQVLTDNLGNRYEAAGGSISFDPDGTSVVRFDTELDPLATELTLISEYYGRVVEGREAITIDTSED